MIGNALLPFASLIIGWLALLPVRRLVGPAAYHMAALPVGLMGWAWMSAWGGVLGLGFSWPYAVAARLLYAALIAAMLFALVGRADNTTAQDIRRFPIWTYVGVGGLIGGFSTLVARSGISLFSADSWADYELMGLWLHDTGDLTAATVAIRNVLIPSFHAAARMMGSDWTYAIYPVLALVVCVLVLDEVYVRATPRIGRAWAGGLAIAVVALMASTAPFLMQSFYVHSHMVSALYMSISLIALGRAYIPAEVGYRIHALDPSRVRRAWLGLAGLAVAGLILARPDGLAYAVVPLALFVTLWAPGGYSLRSLSTIFATTFALPAIVFGLTIARYGLWVQDEKLNAVHVVALLIGYTVAALAMSQLPRWRSAAAWLAEDDNVVRLAVAGAALVFGAATVLAREDFGLAMGNMVRNLVHRGGYNSLWVFAVGLVVLTLVTSGLRRDRMVRHVLVSLALFFITASIVHGLTHVGRTSWGDSFSRVSFHVVPLVFLLLGYVAAVVLECVRAPRQ